MIQRNVSNNNSEIFIVIAILVIFVVVYSMHINTKIEALESHMAHQNHKELVRPSTVVLHLSNYNIEKVEGNGNVFGDNNSVKNDLV